MGNRNANDAFFGESREHWREYGKPQRQTSLIVDPSYYLFEFACHEGNYLSMISMLGGALLAEK